MNDLLIGTIGAPEMLAGDIKKRQSLIDEVVDSGIDHLFLADHISFRNGSGMDALVNAAILTGMHPDLKVCIGVYLLALRHPMLVARQLNTLAQSAPGRLVFGVGVGGEDRHEFEVCGVDPATRGKRTDAILKVLRPLLAGEIVNEHNPYFTLEQALIRPAVSMPPVLIGGRSNAALERAARFGDGWLAVWCSPKRFIEATGLVEARAADIGRANTAWRHGLQVWVGIDDDKRRAREFVAAQMKNFYGMPFEAFEKYSPYGTAGEVADFLAAYVEGGASLLNIKACASSEAAAIAGVAEVSARLKGR